MPHRIQELSAQQLEKKDLKHRGVLLYWEEGEDKFNKYWNADHIKIQNTILQRKDFE